MIKTLLIANRGEIAHRIIQTAEKLGIETVAVYTKTDCNTPHMLAADQAVLLEEKLQSVEPYLDIERLIEVAQKYNADAIHPGYGFLSENPKFAETCESAGIIFVGPTAHAIRLMADKAEGKARMQDVNVPSYRVMTEKSRVLKLFVKRPKKSVFPFSSKRLPVEAAAVCGELIIFISLMKL